MARVLVVEDDPDIADTLQSLLEDAGHEVRVAQNGREGLDEVTRAMPELVLLDVEMPILTGPDMAYQMFVIDCGLDLIPIVLLSGVAGLHRVAEQVGTPYFQAKPFHIDALTAVVERALAERRAPVPQLRGRA